MRLSCVAKRGGHGSAIRELPRLRKVYGRGRWRKPKAIATDRFLDGSIAWAEVRWYEATCIDNLESPAALELRKIDVTLPDSAAEKCPRRDDEGRRVGSSSAP